VNAEEIAQAFVELAPRVALLAMRAFRMPREDAIDAVQNAYIRLRRHLDTKGGATRFQTSSDLFGYMIGAVRSYASHERERMGRNEALLWRALTPEPVANPEDEFLSKEQEALLWQAIEALEEPTRSVFKLLLKKEMELAEIGRQLGLGGEVYKRYREGRRHLQKFFQLR